MTDPQLAPALNILEFEHCFFNDNQGIMLDIETLATDDRAAVFSIAAVSFSPNSRDFVPADLHPLGQGAYGDGVLKATDYHPQYVSNVVMSDNILHGRTFSESTIKWWSEQGDTLKRLLAAYPTRSAEEAFGDLSKFLLRDKDEAIWGNPPRFDMGIIASYFKTLGLPEWQHWRERCYRSMRNIAFVKNSPYLEKVKPWWTQHGDAHDPLLDCKIQICTMQLINILYNELMDKRFQ